MYSQATQGTAVLSPSPDPKDTEHSTRDRVLRTVLQHGPITAAELGSTLGFTPAAVRRHLDRLESEGLIGVKEVQAKRAKAGRPARHYVVNPAAQVRLGNRNGEAAVAAVEQLRALGGETAVKQFAARQADRQERLYTETVSAAAAGQERAEALAEALSEDDYVAFTRTVDISTGTQAMRSLQLCQAHCPLVDVARHVPEICEAEAEMFARVLDVDVRRLSTMAAGGHVCTLHIPLGRDSALTKPEKRTRIKISRK
ncbi:MAG: helix-turn-helix transcriptional regulator [Galactobacter sp.]